MFEKEAEEYQIRKHHQRLYGNKPVVMKELNTTYKDGFKDGYNKANEWHYVKDGDLPKDEKNFKSYVVAYYGAKGSIANGKPCWEELCYDTENKRWVDKDTLDNLPYVNQEGIVIAWKEIVLPELPKESE